MRHESHLTPTLARRTLGNSLPALIIYVNIAVILVSDYTDRLSAFLGMSHEAWVNSTPVIGDIAIGEGIEPYRSRILVPILLLGVSKASSVTSYQIDLATTHWVFYALCLTLVMLFTQLMLQSLGYSRSAGMVGALIVGGLLPIALRDHGYQPWSWLEWWLVPATIWLAIKRPPLIVVILLSAVTTLNRETAVLTPLIFAAVALSDRYQSKGVRSFIPSIASLATVGAILVSLKFIWPGRGSVTEMTLQTVHHTNLLSENISRTTTNLVLLFGALVFLGVIGLIHRDVPRTSLYILVAIGPLTLCYWLYFALWWEVRVLAPLVMVILPLTISGLGLRPHRLAAADSVT